MKIKINIEIPFLELITDSVSVQVSPKSLWSKAVALRKIQANLMIDYICIYTLIYLIRKYS